VASLFDQEGFCMPMLVEEVAPDSPAVGMAGLVVAIDMAGAQCSPSHAMFQAFRL
jgi:hypothetical protein